MANSEEARANLLQYVEGINTKDRRRIKIYLDWRQDGALISVHIRTSGHCLSQAAFMDDDVVVWSKSTMYITSANLRVGSIDIAVSPWRTNYSLGLVTHTLQQILAEEEA